MGTFLPNGYGIWKPTVTLVGSTKIFQTAIMFFNNSSQSAAACNTPIRGYWTDNNSPLGAPNMFVGYTMAYCECYVMLGGELTYDINLTPVVGTKAGSTGSPINTSIIVRKVTGVVGKRYRGRIMLPNMTCPEADISQAGIMSGTGLTAVTNQYTNVYTLQGGGQFPFRLGHTASEVIPTPITGFSVNTKIGSMPHRIRGF